MDKTPKKRRRLPRSGLASEILDAGPSGAPPVEPPAGTADQEASAFQEVEPEKVVLDFIDQVSALSDQLEPKKQVETIKVVTFRLGAELFGVEIRRALEVVRVEEVVEVPQAPVHVRGITNLRGRILPVLEIRTRMGMEPAIIGPSSRIVVVEGHNRRAGLLVDSVAHVVTLPTDQIEPPPEGTTTASSDYVSGLGKSDRGLVILIDVDRVMLVK